MSNEVKVIFANDPIVTENAAIKQFVANQKAGHSSVLIEETHYIVVKECKEKDATLEKVRATAGNIARDVSAQKVETAIVEAEILSNAYAKLDKGSVLTAFAEGWELGAYQFVTYKSDVTAFQTELHVVGEEAKPFVEAGKIRAAATAFSRDLMNELSNVLNPETFPEVLKKNFEGTDVEVNVLRQRTA